MEVCVVAPESIMAVEKKGIIIKLIQVKKHFVIIDSRYINNNLYYLKKEVALKVFNVLSTKI